MWLVFETPSWSLWRQCNDQCNSHSWPNSLNTLGHDRNCRHFVYDICKCIPVKEFVFVFWIRLHQLWCHLAIDRPWLKQWLGAKQATGHYVNQWGLGLWHLVLGETNQSYLMVHFTYIRTSHNSNWNDYSVAEYSPKLTIIFEVSTESKISYTSVFAQSLRSCIRENIIATRYGIHLYQIVVNDVKWSIWYRLDITIFCPNACCFKFPKTYLVNNKMPVGRHGQIKSPSTCYIYVISIDYEDYITVTS